MSTKRYLTVRDLPPVPSGCCRWCGAPLPGRRTSWCGNACRGAFALVAFVDVQRSAVLERDRGVCSTCGLDTLAIWNAAWAAVSDVHRETQARQSEVWREHGRRRILADERETLLWKARFAGAQALAAIRERWNQATSIHGAPWTDDLKSQPPRVWEMDHVVPVVEGGGVRHGMTRDEVLRNLRTLCIPCHKRETAALAARRASSRREAVQPSLLLGGGDQ